MSANPDAPRTEGLTNEDEAHALFPSTDAEIDPGRVIQDEEEVEAAVEAAESLAMTPDEERTMALGIFPKVRSPFAPTSVPALTLC